MDELHTDHACRSSQYSNTGMISLPYQLNFPITCQHQHSFNQQHERLICKNQPRQISQGPGEQEKKHLNAGGIVIIVYSRVAGQSCCQQLEVIEMLCVHNCGSLTPTCAAIFIVSSVFCVKFSKNKLHMLFPFTAVEWILERVLFRESRGRVGGFNYPVRGQIWCILRKTHCHVPTASAHAWKLRSDFCN